MARESAQTCLWGSARSNYSLRHIFSAFPGLPPGGAGNRPGPALPASVPRTPHHPKSGAALADLIRSLESKWQLGLKVQDGRSPAQSRTIADKTCRAIQYLFYSNRGGLNDALAIFEQSGPFLRPEARLELLHGKLKSLLPQSPGGPKIATPVSARNKPLNNMKSPLSSQPSRSADIFQGYRTGQAEPQPHLQLATTFDPGSPTDEDDNNNDDDGYVTPPSPTVSSRSAQRRVQASPRFSLGPTARKRPSDSSNDSEKSPKLSKISRGKQPAIKFTAPGSSKPCIAPKHPSPPAFKKPTREMARSFHAAPSISSSVNTSFNTNTVSSSQQTQADTVNTSFTSNYGVDDLQRPGMTRTSSTTMGSLDDNDIVNLSMKLEFEVLKQEQLARISSQDNRESTSTFGSVDEDGLIDASCRAEVEHIPAFPPLLRPPVDTASKLDGTSGYRSPAKSKLFDRQPPGTTTSFPAAGKITSPDQPILRPRSSSVGTTPSRAVRPGAPTPVDSPSRVSHYIRDIPKQGLFVDDLPDDLKSVPYFLAFIGQRIALQHSIPIGDLMRKVDISSSKADPDTFWASIQTHPKISHVRLREPSGLWQARKRQFDGFTFKGQITLNSKRSGPVFNLQLQPVQKDASCRFQRKFGSDRFLYLQAPVWASKASRFNAAEMKYIQERWKTWLLTEHSFLGRKWRVFHVESLKRKSNAKKQEALYDKRLVLFAVDGCGIDQPHTIGEMLNWFLPFAHNENQTFLKAFARFDLGLSRTVSTLMFLPSSIRFVDDIMSNGERETTQFNDRRLRWKSVPKNQVMNDGCAVISVGAAKLIWKIYKEATKSTETLMPSAFQGRIGGAKGLWMISAESYTKDPEHTAVWIQISKSQLKFDPHPEDMNDDGAFDPHRLTFEVSNYSSPPTPSELHISFIQIMVDRGVPGNVIAEFMTEHLDAERKQLLEILQCPTKTYEWVHKNSAKTRGSGDTLWEAALPVSLEEKLKLMLESGFSPVKSEFLAQTLGRFIQTKQISQESKLRTPLPKSTFRYGVADPFGVLKPGEVHVHFSRHFLDQLADEQYLCLRDMDVLVARQPACRHSDIQKVHAVIHPALSHLVDVIVFPSRGEYPLAGKLQGGDYDGDMFWVCWEPKLVDPFKNAPAPVTSPDPAKYGIKKDTRKLGDVMDTTDLDDVDALLREAFEFRDNPSLLGMVTVMADNQVYRENRLFSAVLEQLFDIHDLLVDAIKQGYTFMQADLDRFVKCTLKIEPPKKPAYKAAMGESLAAKETSDVEKVRAKNYRHKSDRVLDYLYFGVLRAHNIETMNLVKDECSKSIEVDEDLLYMYKNLKSKQHPVIDEVLRTIRESLIPIYAVWTNGFHKDSKKEKSISPVKECYEKYLAIQPIHSSDPEVRPWLEPYTDPHSSLWAQLKASVLYAKYDWPNKQSFVFKMAGKELAHLKAKHSPGARLVILAILGNMKPKPIKAPIELDEEEDASEDEFDSATDQITG
ncbi:hypothetical protein P153DRAFT_391578 [Dothidotthia symphoricarpi CBS 119687]|uniref:RNA-dependent RNA polymerase n=1 Tax=Dothidotthia symphoricarpi CBS 119687 TaxID=1392245 RepID=A0A6A5ZYM6_9PLEO|nr:uncharacterized protein P153DRAFT_391578 [Dothidotthia symphoricarpi CBS 119687]KAF2123488.1 hypothetical protein P153DRAFT_391578 [Dothidotthia symphoricarpi CBS 119687]